MLLAVAATCAISALSPVLLGVTIGVLPVGQTVFNDPRHPYTVGLMQSFPPLSGPIVRMAGIPGSPPDLGNAPAGCRFHPRCPHCRPEDGGLYRRQTTERPKLRVVSEGHSVACHLVEAQG